MTKSGVSSAKALIASIRIASVTKMYMGYSIIGTQLGTNVKLLQKAGIFQHIKNGES